MVRQLVAHDLRTPLSSITWSSANLLDGLVGPLNEGQNTYLESISCSAAHLNRLVNNLIEISQLDSGEFQFHVRELELTDVIKEAVCTITPAAVAKDVNIVLTGQSQRVVSSEDKLAVVLVNLLDNAVKYSPPGGEVELCFQARQAGLVELTISDQGPGFGSDQNVFQRFVQGQASPYSQQRGFGLGVFIVKNYLNRLDGSITVADQDHGGGLVICLLPAADEVWSEMSAKG